MPSKSKSQQRFFGLVYRCKKTGEGCEGNVGKTADSISLKDARKFAKTKHKNLPNTVNETLTFKQYLLETMSE